MCVPAIWYCTFCLYAAECIHVGLSVMCEECPSMYLTFSRNVEKAGRAAISVIKAEKQGKWGSLRSFMHTH